MSSNIVSCVQCPDYGRENLESAVRRSLEEAGGWPKSVLSAKRILLKPNLLSARPPCEAVTTHPEFVRAVIREIRKIGVKEICLGDSPAGNYGCEELWTKTGMKKIAEEENAALIPFANIRRMEIQGYGVVPLLKELDDFDAVVNLPKLKTHILTKITGAVKNVFGLVPGNAKSSFHGRFTSPRTMSDFLAAFYVMVKPDFTLMDSVESLAGNGPANGFPFKAGLIFAGADAIQVDSCACELYGYEAKDIRLLELALKYDGHDANFLREIKRAGDGWRVLKGIRAPRSSTEFIHKIPDFIFHPLSYLLTCRPSLNHALCVRCGRCADVCSQKAIIRNPDGTYKINLRKCILCMCCMESCDRHAIEIASLGLRIRRLIK